MHTTTYTYKENDYGNPLIAKVSWPDEVKVEETLPIIIIFHGGGLTVGSADIIPAPQVEYLAAQGCIVVIPNYRLCPQVSALDGAFADSASALKWCQTDLPERLKQDHGISVDTSRIAAMGHSAGGTLALSFAAQSESPLKAVTAFYPSLYISDVHSTAHQPYAGFAAMPPFQATEENLKALSPPSQQVSEFPLSPPKPGQLPPPRSLWLLNQLKNGTWIKAIQPDGNWTAIDPCTQFADRGSEWPPTMFVQGDKDDSPGSNIEYVKRAVEELKSAGAHDAQVTAVEGAMHMFDMDPSVGTTDMGARWVAVKKGLDFLVTHV